MEQTWRCVALVKWCNYFDLPPELVDLLVAEDVSDPTELSELTDEELTVLTQGMEMGPKGRFFGAVHKLRATSYQEKPDKEENRKEENEKEADTQAGGSSLPDAKTRRETEKEETKKEQWLKEVQTLKLPCVSHDKARKELHTLTKLPFGVNPKDEKACVLALQGQEAGSHCTQHALNEVAILKTYDEEVDQVLNHGRLLLFGGLVLSFTDTDGDHILLQKHGIDIK